MHFQLNYTQGQMKALFAKETVVLRRREAKNETFDLIKLVDRGIIIISLR